MKQIIITCLLLFVFSLQLIAVSDSRIKDSDRTWRLAETVKHNWQFNGNNIWKRNIYYYNPEVTTQIDSVRIYYLDADSVWVYRNRQTYAYEQLSNGYIVRIYSDNHAVGLPDFITQETRYNGDGNILFDNQYNAYYTNNEYEYTIIKGTTNYYSNEGRLIGYDTYDWILLPNPPYHRYELEYDDSGRRSVCNETISPDSLNYTNYIHVEYEYMTTGNTCRISQENRYRWINETWDYNIQNRYYYYDNDQHIINTYFYWIETYWSSMDSYEHFYDNNGHLIREFNDPQFPGGPENDYYYTWVDYVSNDDEMVTHAEFEVMSYPNPFSSTVSFKLSGVNKAPYDISIYNIKGQLVRQWTGLTSNELSWNGKDRQANTQNRGIYLLKVNQKGKSFVNKILKY